MVEAEKVLVVLHIRNWTFSPTPSVDSIRESASGESRVTVTGNQDLENLSQSVL